MTRKPGRKSSRHMASADSDASLDSHSTGTSFPPFLAEGRHLSPSRLGRDVAHLIHDHPMTLSAGTAPGSGDFQPSFSSIKQPAFPSTDSFRQLSSAPSSMATCMDIARSLRLLTREGTQLLQDFFYPMLQIMSNTTKPECLWTQPQPTLDGETPPMQASHYSFDTLLECAFQTSLLPQFQAFLEKMPARAGVCICQPSALTICWAHRSFSLLMNDSNPIGRSIMAYAVPESVQRKAPKFYRAAMDLSKICVQLITRNIPIGGVEHHYIRNIGFVREPAAGISLPVVFVQLIYLLEPFDVATMEAAIDAVDQAEG